MAFQRAILLAVITYLVASLPVYPVNDGAAMDSIRNITSEAEISVRNASFKILFLNTEFNELVKHGNRCDIHETTLADMTDICDYTVWSQTTPLSSLGSQYDNFLEAKIYFVLIRYYYYFTNIPGFITNPISLFLIIHIKPFNTTSLYIAVLSMNDFFLCILRFTFLLLHSVGLHWSSNACRFFQFFIHSTSVFSNYILACWTIERLCAMYFPSNFNRWFLIARVKVLLIMMLCLALNLSFPYLFGFYAEKSPTDSGMICLANTFLYGVWFYVNITYCVFIPLVVIFACYIAIVERLHRTLQIIQSMTINKNVIKRKQEELRRLTITLIRVALVFVMLHVPYVLAVVWLLLYTDPFGQLRGNPVGFIRFHLYTFIGFTVSEVHNWINVFVYVLSEKGFRFCGCKVRCNSKFQTPSHEQQIPELFYLED